MHIYIYIYIKIWCENGYVMDAFTSIIFDHCTEARPQIPDTNTPDKYLAKGDKSII